MNDYVRLHLKRNRGWPWPEKSWGLTAMFGADGWCRACGVPRGPQTGSLVLGRKGITPGKGAAWTPHWQYDAICLERSLADRVATHFDVDLIAVAWHGTPPCEAMQIVVPSVGEAWFDPEELASLTHGKHGKPGALCPECRTWRWMPLSFEVLPPLRLAPPLEGDIVASPEWFGDGWQAYREILVRRELAGLIAESSPRDFNIERSPG